MLNDAYAHYARRLSRIFEMHPASHYNTDGLYVKDHEARLAQIAERGSDVILAFPNPRIPKALIYPYDDVVRHFGRAYFASTLAYMIPLAIMDIEESHRKQDGRLLPKLGLWGCDMQLTSEYAKERSCVEYWLAKAEDRGIEIVIPDHSPLLKMGYRYGYETAEIDRRKQLVAGRQRDLQTTIAAQEAQLEDWKRRTSETRGALMETAWALSNLTDEPHRGEEHT